MEVLILSKTHFGNNVCVGGMVLNTNQYVRLLNKGGWYQFADTPFNVGDVWEIGFHISSDLKEPHNEDVIIDSQRFLRNANDLSNLIRNSGAIIWSGSINNIFDSKLLWANSGSGYLSENIINYPIHSVGFWRSDKPLTYNNDHYHYRINDIQKKLKYKGLLEPIDEIPENTLIRVSLAKWWKPADSDVEHRCYAQLSGWYS
jgi:hypothetical protein